MKELEQLRKDWRRSTFIEQHSVNGVKSIIKGMIDYTSCKHGDIKKNEGDIVIVNAKVNDDVKGYINMEEYLSYFLCIDRIEQKGIFTNIYYSREFFTESIKNILPLKEER